MAGCCHDDQCATFEGQSPAYRRALWAVVAINGAMFATELAELVRLTGGTVAEIAVD